jgi:antitoxin HicB
MSAKKAAKKFRAPLTKSVRRTGTARGRVGSSFDDFLRETGDYEAVKSRAIKRVLAWQISEAMREDGLTKAEMAKRIAAKY